MPARKPAGRAVTWLLYLMAGLSVFSTAGTAIALGLLVAAWVWDLARKRVAPADVPRDALLYVAIYAWRALTRAVNTSLGEMLHVRGPWNRVPYPVVGSYALGRREALTLLHVVFLGHALVVLYALAQQHLGAPVVYKPLMATDGYRLRGFYGHANQYAGVVSVVLLVNLAVGALADRRFLLYAPALLAGLVLSGSRTYLLGVAVAALGLLVAARSLRVVLAAGTAALASGALFWFTVPWLPRRLLGPLLGLHGYSDRLSHWTISWQVFLDHPLFGVGADRLPLYLEPFWQAGRISNPLQGHSLFFHELAEGGVVGFLLVIGAHVYFARKYVKVFASEAEPLLRALALGVALAWVNVLAAGVFEYTFGAAVVAMNLNLLMGVVEAHRAAAGGPGAGPEEGAP